MPHAYRFVIVRDDTRTYELATTDDAHGSFVDVNAMLSEGWYPLREIPFESSSKSGANNEHAHMLVLFEKPT